MKPALLLALSLSACSSIDYHRAPPPDWPKLAVKVYDVPYLHPYCPSMHAWACAQIHWDKRLCVVFLPAGASTAIRESLLAHELAHCRGMEHDNGSTTLADAFTEWKRARLIAGQLN